PLGTRGGGGRAGKRPRRACLLLHGRRPSGRDRMGSGRRRAALATLTTSGPRHAPLRGGGERSGGKRRPSLRKLCARLAATIARNGAAVRRVAARPETGPPQRRKRHAALRLRPPPQSQRLL